MSVIARDLLEGISYIYINRLERNSHKYMGKLLLKGDFDVKQREPYAIFIFENGIGNYDWDDTFKVYQPIRNR